MENKWTQSQMQVIKHSAGNLLVSASAGSGKTSVLIEKIVDLILSGNVHLKNLLVVTFTNAASLEIRQRLQSALVDSNNKSLLMELEDLSTSDILTFDSFCIKVVKEFGYIIGKTNNFAVADTSLSGFLQNQAIENIIAKHNKNLDEKFTNVLDVFFDGRKDNTFRANLISLYNFLLSKDDSMSYKDKLHQIYNLNIDNEKNEAIKFFNKYLLKVRDNFKQKIQSMYNQSLSFDDEKVSNCLHEAISLLENFGNDFKKNLSILQSPISFDIPKSSKKDIVEILEIKKQFLNAKKEFNKNLKLLINDEITHLTLSQQAKDIQVSKERLLQLFDLVDEFKQEYNKIKTNMQVLDFIDIEQLASQILNHENVKTALQNKYDWIFIDEYQDTSVLQDGIIKKITTGQNLFMVGDLKQSIYRFRQAEPQIFINKYNSYKKMQSDGSVIELKTNFRSEKSILDFNNFIFDRIYKESIDDLEYKNNADLEYGGKNTEFDSTPHIKMLIVENQSKQSKNSDCELTEIECKNEVATSDDTSQKDEQLDVYSVRESEVSFDEIDDISKQAMVLAKEIKEMLNKKYYDAKSKVYKNIEFRDIAVLSRNKNNVLNKIQAVLNDANIPVSVSYNDELFKNYDMQILLNILKTIQNTHDDIALLSSLSNIGKLSFDELSHIRECFQDEKFFYAAVEKYKKSYNDLITQKINDFDENINHYRVYNYSKDICELINHIVQKEKFDIFFAVNNYGDEFQNHLNLLLTSIQSIKHYSLYEFINFVDSFGSQLTFENSIKESENSVTLSTIHKSKGLEYPVVFLIGAEKEFNMSTDKLLMDNDWGISMASFDIDRHVVYSNLLHNIFKLKIKDENKKEYKRLLYVALTRAKNYLTIIGSNDTCDFKSFENDFDIYNSNNYLDWIMGCFKENELNDLNKNHKLIKNICDNSFVEINMICEDEYDFDVNKSPSIKPEKIKINSKDFIKILNHNFEHNNLAKKNSVTQILNEEDHYNISNFRFDHNDKNQDIDYLKIGTAYHKYMELITFSENMDEINRQINLLKESNKLSSEDENLVDENKIKRAIIELSKIINNQDIVSKEKEFLAYLPANILINSNKSNKILVQGIADLIIIKSDEIFLVDYKTSRLKESDFVTKYGTQLNIYQKAIESFYKKPVTKKFIYSFHLGKLILI